MEPPPPSIEPDTKDWTWVLDRPCGECGFVAADVDVRAIGSAVRANAAAWADVLGRPDAELRTRPAPQRWSPLEYAAHVSDVFDLFDRRLERMLIEDGPHYDNWDPDVTAIESRYDLADPVAVRETLVDRAERIAARFDAVTDDDWDRTGFRSDGAAFTVESFARYLLHDPVHHLHDVGDGRYGGSP